MMEETNDTFCGICLKTSKFVSLVHTDAKEFFETMKTIQQSPWLCVWCVTHLRHFHELRRRMQRSHRLLSKVKIGSLTKNDTYFREELNEIQKEKYVINHFPVLILGNEKTKHFNDAQVIHSASSRCDLKMQNIFKFRSSRTHTNAKHEKKKSASNLEQIQKAAVTVQTEILLKRETIDENKYVTNNAVHQEDDECDFCDEEILHTLMESGQHDQNTSSICSDAPENGIFKPDPLGNDDGPEQWDVPAERYNAMISSTSTADRKSVNDNKKEPLPKRKKRKIRNTPSKINKKLDTRGESDLSRADALRRDINAGQKEIVLNETDDMRYVTADVVLANVTRVTLSEAQERGAHAQRLACAKYINMRYRCQSCAGGWASRPLYEKHMRRHSPSAGEFECGACGTRHRSRAALRAHAARHYRAFRCRACSAALPTQQHAANHYFTRHAGIRFRCAYCDKGYKSLVYLKKHFTTHNKEDAQHQSMCHICKKVYDTSTSDSKYRFNSHVRSHGEGKLTFQCPVCRKTVVASRRSNHMKVHAEAVPCPQCHKSFRCRDTLQQHVERIHAQTKRYQCDACGKLFFGKSDVRTHIEWTHMRIGGVTCTICGMTFRKEYILQQHTRKVHENNPKPKDKLCDICGRGFAQRSIMEQHRLIHTGAKPHKCEHCGQMFRQKTAMNTHIKLKHLNVKWSDMMAGRRQRRKGDRLHAKLE